MSWKIKSRISQDGTRGKIKTPDGLKILVGELNNLILSYPSFFNYWLLKSRTEQLDWSLKTRTEQIWNLKARINQRIEQEEIFTPDGQEILVGSPEDEVLVYQLSGEVWNNKTKIEQTAWSLKPKIES